MTARTPFMGRPVQSRRSRYSQRARRQRGQALVEFAFFFTAMMLVLAGVIDIALLLDAHLNVVYAARQGARTGAVLGNSNLADCAILGAIEATLLNQSDVTVTQIIIYRANPNGMPSAGGASQEVYTGNASCPAGTTANPGATLPVVPSPSPSVNNWPSLPTCPTPIPSPQNCRNTTPFAEDTLGVQINYQFRFQFNLWEGGTLNLSDFAVYPMVVQV